MRASFKSIMSAGALFAVAVLVTACAAGPGPAATEPETASNHEHELEIDGGWAKSAAANGMTGVFGTLINHSDDDLTITGVKSDAAGLVELHEVTAEGVMQEIAGDVVVPAGGTRELAPGADHVMLMQLHHDLLAGDEVTFTLNYEIAGESLSSTFSVLVKDYSGANEDYGHGASADAHGGHADADAHGSH